MATLYKKPNSPFYFAQYFNADGKRVSKSTGTTLKREALRLAAGYESKERDERLKADHLPKAYAVLLETATREAAAGQLTLARAEEFIKRLHKLANPEYAESTLREYWQAWIADQKRHVGASTASGYEQDLQIFEEALGVQTMDAPVNALTTAKINKAIDKLKKKGDRRASTINKALSSLRRVMERAVTEGVSTSNPAKQSRSLHQTDSIERAPFTPQEIRSMLDHPATSDEWKGAILIGAHTGLRMGDVTRLSSVQVEGSRLVIMPSKTARQKKVITVPLTAPCLAWIGARKGSFFPTLSVQGAATTSMQFAAIMNRAGIPKEIELPGGFKASRSFHSLRHTFASWLANADIHADVRQKLTGHSSSKIHARYSHHDEALDNAVKSLPEL